MADLLLPDFPAPTKRCNKCGEVKPIDEFHFRSDQRNADGTRRRKQPCKRCYNDALLRHRADNPQVNQAWIEANRPTLRQQARANYKRRRANLRGWLTTNLTTRRQQCRKARIIFDISVDQILALYDQQNGRCALTGRELIWGVDSNRGPDTLSVDRIDATGPYIIENVRLVTHWANVARQRYGDEELFAFCEAVLATRASTANSC